jgi:hypothetical protein
MRKRFLECVVPEKHGNKEEPFRNARVEISDRENAMTRADEPSFTIKRKAATTRGH